jgi:hypothetical protein
MYNFNTKSQRGELGGDGSGWYANDLNSYHFAAKANTKMLFVIGMTGCAKVG